MLTSLKGTRILLVGPEQRSLADHWWHVRSRSSLEVRGRSKELKGLGGLS